MAHRRIVARTARRLSRNELRLRLLVVAAARRVKILQPSRFEQLYTAETNYRELMEVYAFARRRRGLPAQGLATDETQIKHGF